MEDDLVEVGEKERGADKFLLLSVTNCKPVVF